jgi:hypothetical protein
MSQTLSRGLAAVAVSGLAVFTVATPAHAVPCEYPNEDQNCPVVDTPTQEVSAQEANAAFSGDDLTFTVGELITVTKFPPVGRTPFGPGTLVTISVGGIPIGTFPADVRGQITASFRLPAGTPAGATVFVFAGISAAGAVALTYSVPIVVDGGGDSGGDGAGGGLPFTGAEVGIAPLVGAGLLGAGTIAVAAGRRRKAAPAAA